MTVVDERPCRYCGARAGQDCHGYGLVDGDVHLARVRPPVPPEQVIEDLIQAAEEALVCLALSGADASGTAVQTLAKAIERARGKP